MFRRVLLALFLLLPAIAHAEWKKAESNHFIVYGEIGDERLRLMAMRLEKLHLTQSAMTGLANGKQSIKVKVYVVDSFYDVQKTMPFPRNGVAGYYNATPRGPFTVISTESNANRGFSSRLVLFHELTHHFMFQYFPATYPLWYVEGFADFIGATDIKDGSDTVEMGKPNVVRYLSFATTQWYPVRKLLEARNYDDLGDDLHMLYAEGWLLTHYLHFGGKRDGQLEKYLLAINQGKPFAQAARDAFGDLDKLDAELKAYSRRRSGIPGRSVTFKPTALGDVQISPVSPAQNALMLYDIRLHAGISREEGSRFAAQLRRDAARFANDPFALQLRAEAAYLLGDQAELTAVASRWLAAAPNDPKALLFDGLGKARASDRQVHRCECLECRARADRRCDEADPGRSAGLQGLLRHLRDAGRHASGRRPERVVPRAGACAAGRRAPLSARQGLREPRTGQGRDQHHPDCGAAAARQGEERGRTGTGGGGTGAGETRPHGSTHP